MKKNNSFSCIELINGILFDLSQDDFPAKIHGHKQPENKSHFKIENDNSTTFGYVNKDISSLYYEGLEFPLTEGMHFSIPGVFEISGGEVILIEFFNYKGFFNIGKGIEAIGRLKYIDDCTDSILVNPIKKGDPCLNSLYFPKNTFQTQHTHPSFRIGLVISGSGYCLTPEGKIPLHEGFAFLIPKNCIHSFSTFSETMTVVAFHPDSDFGPEDENHPMINRTFIDGTSAKFHKDKLTK